MPTSTPSSSSRPVQPFPPATVGIFAPSPSDEEHELIQKWLGEQHTFFLSLARIHDEAIKEGRRDTESKWKREEDLMDDDDADDG